MTQTLAQKCKLLSCCFLSKDGMNIKRNEANSVALKFDNPWHIRYIKYTNSSVCIFLYCVVAKHALVDCTVSKVHSWADFS